jgi:dual specificity protein kinase YAK1
VPQQVTRGPVPEFKQLSSPADLQPKVNSQPPFRRANPEGGFISVCFQASTAFDTLLLTI